MRKEQLTQQQQVFYGSTLNIIRKGEKQLATAQSKKRKSVQASRHINDEHDMLYFKAKES